MVQEDVEYIGGMNLNWPPYRGPPPYTYSMPLATSGPLATEEGAYVARWYYPLSPYLTREPHVYLPHRFYDAPDEHSYMRRMILKATVPMEQVGQVGIATNYLNPLFGYGYPNLPAVRGYRYIAEKEEEKPCDNVICKAVDWLKDVLGLKKKEEAPKPQQEKPLIMYYSPRRRIRRRILWR